MMAEDEIDLDALRESIRDVLDVEASDQKAHRFVDGDGGVAIELWNKAAELGWFSLAIPEAHGGMGLGLAELAVVQEELGRKAAPLPYLATVLVAESLHHGGTPAQQAAWLPRLAAGEIHASLRIPEPGDGPARLRLSRGSDGRIRLDGEIEELLDGAGAHLVLVEAATEQGASCFLLVEPERDGVTIEKQSLWDLTRHLGRARCDGLVLPEERRLDMDAARLRPFLLDRSAIAIACDAIGGADAIFLQTLDYLKTREQFGRPVGSFQALKHRCADMKVALEVSRAMVAEAIAKSVLGAPDASLHASLAKLQACDVAASIAEEAVQLHGGIGFAWEHACHLFLKRAKLNQALGGGAAAQADRAAQLLIAA